jgi:hypothetical protein
MTKVFNKMNLSTGCLRSAYDIASRPLLCICQVLPSVAVKAPFVLRKFNRAKIEKYFVASMFFIVPA